MNELLLTGLDGANPLAFMAALGVLEALSETHSAATLHWRYHGGWRPVVQAPDLTRESLIVLLDEDRQRCANDPALALEYAGTHDLKPPPRVFREYAARILEASSMTQRRSIDWVAAFATDIAVDNKGNTKPTALHFTAGQQTWLAMVLQLVAMVEPEDFSEALWGPWTYQRLSPVMGWDATANRDYALRASNPSGDKKTGVPGADWLAVRGLSFFPVVPRGSKVLTTGCHGEWKTGTFLWSLWEVPLEREMIRTLLRFSRLKALSERERSARGIVAVFEASIRRSDQGGYGSLSPPQQL
jgi:hypothetical protein